MQFHLTGSFNLQKEGLWKINGDRKKDLIQLVCIGEGLVSVSSFVNILVFL